MGINKKRDEMIYYFAKTLAHKSLEAHTIVENINWLLDQLIKHKLIGTIESIEDHG